MREFFAVLNAYPWTTVLVAWWILLIVATVRWRQ